MTKAKFNIATKPVVIESHSVSDAWAQVYLHVLQNPGTEIAPLVVTIDGFDVETIAESEGVRQALDLLLSKKGKTSIENVAFTIFPQKYLKIARGNRHEMYKLYNGSFGRIQSANRQLNGRGLYFQRMIQYEGAPLDGNQLEWIISQYTGRIGVRRSMFQAAIFDARKDHVAQAQLGFPCMQYISFEPTKAGLVVNAFYATQQIFDKAYGNYLGLAQLGMFMAKEMGTTLSRLNITVGVAKFERITKSDTVMKPLILEAKSLVGNCETPQVSA